MFTPALLSLAVAEVAVPKLSPFHGQFYLRKTGRCMKMNHLTQSSFHRGHRRGYRRTLLQANPPLHVWYTGALDLSGKVHQGCLI